MRNAKPQLHLNCNHLQYIIFHRKYPVRSWIQWCIRSASAAMPQAMPQFFLLSYNFLSVTNWKLTLHSVLPGDNSTLYLTYKKLLPSAVTTSTLSPYISVVQKKNKIKKKVILLSFKLFSIYIHVIYFCFIFLFLFLLLLIIICTNNI